MGGRPAEEMRLQSNTPSSSFHLHTKSGIWDLIWGQEHSHIVFQEQFFFSTFHRQAPLLFSLKVHLNALILVLFSFYHLWPPNLTLGRSESAGLWQQTESHQLENIPYPILSSQHSVCKLGMSLPPLSTLQQHTNKPALVCV